MERRKFLFSCGTLATATLAGCTAPGQDTPTPDPDESNPNNTSNPNGTPDPQPEKTVTVTDYSFEKIQDAPEEHTIQSASNGEFVVEGTVAVKNGCMTIDLGSPPEMADSNPLTIKAMIGTRDTGGDMCTQAIQHLGYRLTFTTEGDAVEEIQIAQAGVNSKVTTLEVEN